MRQPISARKRRQGFTLLELMITVVIVGILASIAYPSFMGSIRKGRRADAVEGMTKIQQAQERWRAKSSSYSSSFAELGASNTSGNGHYTYTLAVGADAAAGSVYSITAQAQGSQVNDTPCRYLRVAMAGGTLTYSSSADGSTWNSAGSNPCWSK